MILSLRRSLRRGLMILLSWLHLPPWELVKRQEVINSLTWTKAQQKLLLLQTLKVHWLRTSPCLMLANNCWRLKLMKWSMQVPKNLPLLVPNLMALIPNRISVPSRKRNSPWLPVWTVSKWLEPNLSKLLGKTEKRPRRNSGARHGWVRLKTTEKPVLMHGRLSRLLPMASITKCGMVSLTLARKPLWANGCRLLTWPLQIRVSWWTVSAEHFLFLHLQ